MPVDTPQFFYKRYHLKYQQRNLPQLQLLILPVNIPQVLHQSSHLPFYQRNVNQFKLMLKVTIPLLLQVTVLVRIPQFYHQHYYLIRLVTAQVGTFLYTRSHFSALQNCALLLSIYFLVYFHI